MDDEENRTQKIKEDLQNLAEQVENTERQLDQWRDEQLQKNRVFWDEYRRQVENFTSSRLRTLEYDFTRREELHERLLRRLKCAQYLHEHLHLVDEQFPSGLIDFLSKVDLDTVSMSNVEQLEEYSILDCIRLPNDDDDEEIEL